MSLFRRTHTEVAGAWRSLRYDLGRRPDEPPTDGPDMTSTGMNTFGGGLPFTGDGYTGYGLDESGYGTGETGSGAGGPRPVVTRPGRRATLVAAFGALTVIAATGAYLGVVRGLGAVLAEKPAAADTFAAPAATADAGIGGGPVTSPGRSDAGPNVRPDLRGDAKSGSKVADPAPVATTAAVIVPPRPADPAPRQISPVRTTKPTKPECRCAEPPVPTPTAPTSSPSPTPSASPSDSGSPSPSGSSATPGDSAEPSRSSQARHRRRHN
jgi:hypothetical protein